ncbi:enoyl-CoA hydratase/isomerase family protein [Elusimicrobiota bacterium]
MTDLKSKYFTHEYIEEISLIKLNRPPSNSLSVEMMDQLRQQITQLANDKKTRAIALSTSIPKYFSSGLDLDEFFHPDPNQREKLFMSIVDLYREILLCPKPTIAVISGAALLGGWIVAMACDFRYIAEENGKISLSEVKLGTTPTSIMISRLSHMAVNQSLVKDILLTGKTLKAKEAIEGGFADKAVPMETVLAESVALAKKLSDLPTNAYATIKKSYIECQMGNLDALIAKSREEFLTALKTPECIEGFTAAKEKRRPKFKDI